MLRPGPASVVWLGAPRAILVRTEWKHGSLRHYPSFDADRDTLESGAHDVAGILDDEAQGFCTRFDYRPFSDREPFMVILWMAELEWLMAC